MQEHLSAEQNAALGAVLSGKSIFLTGGAGTGKSFTLQHIIAALKTKLSNRPGAVAVVAPTGAAALQVGGNTIHNWSGLAMVDNNSAPKLSKWKRQAWQQVHVLIIDEIAMVSDWMLDLLDRMGRETRHQQGHLPFGGVQVVLCGDFLQLPPIVGKFCFKSKAWQQAITPDNCFELLYAYRQGEDHDFAALLAQVRVGNNGDSILADLQKQHPQQQQPQQQQQSDIEPTRLYSKKDDVYEENMQNLGKLATEMFVFTARDEGPHWALETKKVASWTNAPAHLSLKVGAQVILLKNIDIQQGLVNGARGIVVGFSEGTKPVVRFVCGETITLDRATWTLTRPDDRHAAVATRSQFPLDLAWAITVHKSQGMSLDLVHTDLSECFADGMAYVALSRCRTLQGLTVKNVTAMSIRANKEAIAFHASISQRANAEEEGTWPNKRHRVAGDSP